MKNPTSQLKAYAKINLCLDIIRKRNDGYHDLRMVVQTIDIYDDVTVEAIQDEKIQITTNSPLVPIDSSNTVYKAAQLMKNKYSLPGGFKIHIYKRIPPCAGLAGGSSDAAAVLIGIKNIFGIGTSSNNFADVSRKVSADIPFLMNGGTALVEGIGEVLTKLNPVMPLDIVIIKPNVDASTPLAYKNFRFEDVLERPNIDEMIEGINGNNLPLVVRNLKNVLEPVSMRLYPQIAEAKKQLLRTNPTGCVMTGSGSAVFGIYESPEAAKHAYSQIQSSCENSACFLTSSVNYGPDVEKV